MTDADLVAKKLALLETCLADLRRLGRPDRIESDLKERRFVEHSLQLAIQAMLDVASHIVSDERLGEPRSAAELFVLLAANGWLPAELASILRAAVGFRNVLVHGYTEVDPAIVRSTLENNLGDLEAFIDCIRQRLSDPAT